MVIGQLLSLLWFNWSIINAEDYPIRAWLCIWMDNRLALFAKLWNWRPFVLVFQTAQGSKEIEIERWKRPSYQPPIDQIKASNKTHTHTHKKNRSKEEKKEKMMNKNKKRETEIEVKKKKKRKYSEASSSWSSIQCLVWLNNEMQPSSARKPFKRLSIFRHFAAIVWAFILIYTHTDIYQAHLACS